jgi:ADP-ribose pyrophosphatase YjhB (NUDIX family)
MPFQQELYLIADELRATAAQGLRFTDGGYDRERYEKIMKASARIVGILENQPAEAILTQFLDNLYHISPVLCVESVVMRDGKMLLIQRQDDGLWAIPGGLAEVGETPAQAAERELWEEAGVHGHAPRLLGLFDSRPWQMRSKTHLVSAMFQLDTDDTPRLHNAGETPPDGLSAFQETLAVDYFAEQDLPPLSQGHHVRVPWVFRMIRGEVSIPFFDQ